MNHELKKQHSALLGKYHDLSLLGRGSQATMVKALDKKNSPVAIKIFDLKNSDDWKNADLFEREIAVLKNLNVHGVPRFIEKIKTNEYIYLVEEYIPALSLEKQLDDGRKFSLDECVTIFERTAAILKDLGECVPPVVHRDIKPANLLVDDNLNVYLIDFGVVANKTATFSMTFAGTAGYVAPEQLYGKANIASDIFSLGATMLHLVTGISPCDMQLDGIEPDIDKYMTSKIPAWLREIIKRMMSVDPEMRPQSGEELVSYIAQNKETHLVNRHTYNLMLQTVKKNKVKILAALTCISLILTCIFSSLAFSHPLNMTITIAVNVFLIAYSFKNAIENRTKERHKEADNSKLFSSISEQDLSEAVKTQLKSAKDGDSTALAKLGARYLYGNDVIKDENRGYMLVLNAANMGNPDGMFELGNCYYFGKGTRVDKKKAVHWFAKAAENGDFNAQRTMGDLYSNGDGVEQDEEKAIFWYNKAIKGGSANALNNLGIIYRELKDEKKAFECFLESANKNSVAGQENVGLGYLYGRGVEVDYEQAIVWFQKAATNGSVTANVRIAEMCEKGLGCEKDENRAFALYHDAAMMGDAHAEYRLGLCYEKGLGVNKSIDHAVNWYNKSASQGYESGLYMLGRCYYFGTGVVQDYDLAFKWFQKAALQENHYAEFYLGVIYDEGKGTTVDYKMAYKWYLKSAESGVPEAQHNLGILYRDGHGVPVDKKKARTWLRKAADQGFEDAKRVLSEM